MKITLALSTAVMIALTGCVSTTGPEPATKAGPTRITTAADFNRLVVGKRLALDGNHLTIQSNGKMSGEFSGKPLAGTWEWKNGYWCRSLTSHSKDTDCQLWMVKGNQHTVTRNKGNGKTFTYAAQ